MGIQGGPKIKNDNLICLLDVDDKNSYPFTGSTALYDQSGNDNDGTLIISGTAIFFFMAKVGLAATHTGIVIAHIILGTPFVVITVTATLTGFDHSVTRAAASLGSNPVNTFMKITLPLILPGVISGALFAFVTSFDEVVVVLFLAGLDNTTIPIQMWVGLREQLSPTILAVATCLIVMSILILVSAELLRRRSERLRGINR